MIPKRNEALEPEESVTISAEDLTLAKVKLKEYAVEQGWDEIVDIQFESSEPGKNGLQDFHFSVRHYCGPKQARKPFDPRTV